MRAQIKVALSALFLSSILAVSSGCAQGDAGDRNQSEGQSGLRPMNNGIGRSVPDNRSGEARVNRGQLLRIAEQVPGVERADIAMNATDVVIGIEVDNLGKRRIIEKQVASALNWQYSEYNYHVTSDETLREKIKSASIKQTNGDQAQLLNQDIEALARAIDRSLVRP